MPSALLAFLRSSVATLESWAIFEPMKKGFEYDAFAEGKRDDLGAPPLLTEQPLEHVGGADSHADARVGSADGQCTLQSRPVDMPASTAGPRHRSTPCRRATAVRAPGETGTASRWRLILA